METAKGLGDGGQNALKKRLGGELMTAIERAEEVLNTTAGEITRETEEIRERLITALDAARQAGEEVTRQVVAGARATDKVLRQRPYPFIGAAFGVGLLVGLLMKRK